MASFPLSAPTKAPKHQWNFPSAQPVHTGGVDGSFSWPVIIPIQLCLISLPVNIPLKYEFK